LFNGGWGGMTQTIFGWSGLHRRTIPFMNSYLSRKLFGPIFYPAVIGKILSQMLQNYVSNKAGQSCLLQVKKQQKSIFTSL
jgi:hypothetical protein